MSKLQAGQKVWIEAIVNGSDEGDDPTVELSVDTGGITDTIYAFRSRLSTHAPMSSHDARIIREAERDYVAGVLKQHGRLERAVATKHRTPVDTRCKRCDSVVCVCGDGQEEA